MHPARQPARPLSEADSVFPQEFYTSDQLRRHYSAVLKRLRGDRTKSVVRLPHAKGEFPEVVPVVMPEPQPAPEPDPVQEPIASAPDLTPEDVGPTITRRSIILAVCEVTEILPRELISPLRNRRIVEARFIYCVLARAITSSSFPQIGAAIGGRDHSTVMHAVRTGIKHFEANRHLYEAACAILKVRVPDVTRINIGGVK